MKTIKYSILINKLCELGYNRENQRGSHEKYKNPGIGRSLSIVKCREISPGTFRGLKNIEPRLTEIER